MKNLQNLGDLSHAYQQNASLERERGKYLTGGNAIPLVTATVRFYSMDPYRKYNDPQIEEYINKWICEFKVQNSGIFSLTNIRSYRITQGSAINKNVQQFQPIDMLGGGKETKEFQPTEVFKNPSSAYRTFEIKVEWQLYSYTYIVTTRKDEVREGQNLTPKEVVTKTKHYQYKGKTFSKIEDLKEAIENDMPK